MERVEEVVKEAEREVIRPRFAALRSDDVRYKSPGEVVTVADEEAEKWIAAGLRRILPGAPVVGEEACSSDPALLDALNSDRAWLVDPIDGTANFVAGQADWAVMVALVERGRTVASWIWIPERDAMYVARLGQGATCNGTVLRSAPVRPAAPDPPGMTGAVLTRFLDPETARRVEAHRGRFAAVTGGTGCAGVDYPGVIDRRRQFVLYGRTLPWDHAPGALLVQEAGGVAARLDGSTYHPPQAGKGLLVAADPSTWAAVRDTLLAP